MRLLFIIKQVFNIWEISIFFKAALKSKETQAVARTVTVKASKILLVEDFEPSAVVTGAFLEELGYQYDAAINGKEAVRLAETGQYFAILMDVQMYGMNGFDATVKIRKLEADGKLHKHIIIGMTAHDLPGDKEKCFEVGMDDYVSKPYNVKTLKQKLDSAQAQTV